MRNGARGLHAVHFGSGHLRGPWFWLAVTLVIGIDCRAILAADSPTAPARVTGRVMDEEGNLLAGVLVRATAPAQDMRFVYLGSGHRVVEARTNDQGRYEIQVPLNGETSVAVDAMKPGFRSAAGTRHSGGDRRSGVIKPGETFQASFVLEPSLYVAGTVVDEAGEPVSGADISASAYDVTGYGLIYIAKTDAQGRFEIFNFPLRPEPGYFGTLAIKYDKLLDAELKDVYALSVQEQKSLRIVVKSGRKITGCVVDAMGKPVAGALIEDVFENTCWARRATLTGPDGRFTLTGLLPEQDTILVYALPIRQHLKKVLPFDRDKADLELRLEPFTLSDTDAIELFGMKLATITPAVRAAYLLESNARGVIILDPGRQSARLGIGELHEGDFFSLVGDGHHPVQTLSEFVDRLRASIAPAKGAPPFSVPIVHTFNHVDGRGTNTRYMKLTPDDSRQLDVVASELARRPPVVIEAEPKHGFLGLSTEDNIEKGLAGVRITSVEPDTPAAKAGLRLMEIIFKVDDVEIQTSAQLAELIRSRKPGDKITLNMLRLLDEWPPNVSVVLDEY